MRGVIEGIEECGRVVLTGALFSRITRSVESPVWNGVFRVGTVQGRAPFKAGAAAGYISSLATPGSLLRQTVAGGLLGVGIAFGGMGTRLVLKRWQSWRAAVTR